MAASWSSIPAKSIVLHHALWRALFHEAKHIAGDAAHLDLLGAFGDAIAAVVAVNVFERLVARISQSTVHLHGPIGGYGAQSIGPIVAHRDLVRDRELAENVHAPRGLVYQRAQHLALGLQLDQRTLDALISR